LIRELLLGRSYFLARKCLSQTEYQSSEKLIRLQSSLLSSILLHAVKKIPFYSNLRSNISLIMTDPESGLKKFPIIDKSTVRKYIHSLTHYKFLKGRRVTTGGSTGQPLVFYMDRFKTRQIEKAFIFDQWKRVGYQFGDSIFNLRGRTPQDGKFYHHERLFNIFYGSSFNLKMSTIRQYVKFIDEISPCFIHGYPSTIYQLAKLMEHAGLRLKEKPQAVFCGSEKLFPFQRALIESIFSVRVYVWYGHSECLALGGACENSDVLHFYPQYGYVELLPTGIQNAQGKEIYELLATGFNNPVMPLIRYRTGDYAVLADSQKCSCGRNYLLVDEVLGREQEFIIDKDGEMVSATSLIFGQHYALFSGLDGIYLQQKEPGKLTINLKKNKFFKDDDFVAMKEKMNSLLVDRINIDYIFTENIPLSRIGKTRLVQQEINICDYFKHRTEAK